MKRKPFSVNAPSIFSELSVSAPLSRRAAQNALHQINRSTFRPLFRKKTKWRRNSGHSGKKSDDDVLVRVRAHALLD